MIGTGAALRAVARNVRAARVAAGWSLDQLGARAQVSKGALVAVERATGNPNLATLVRLADALGVSLSALLEEPRADRVRVVSTADTPALWTGEHGGQARLMLTTAGPCPVEVWRWTLHPRDRYRSQPHRPGVVETISVTAGRMTLIVGDTAHEIGDGETVTFEASVPHAYHGAGGRRCDLVMTVQLPPGPGATR